MQPSWRLASALDPTHPDELILEFRYEENQAPSASVVFQERKKG